MAVYVDPLHTFGMGNPKAPRCFRFTPSCHMYADTLDELHIMALGIGLLRSWFQDSPALQHYDLVTSKRDAAIRLGAVEHNRRQAVDKWQELRQTRIEQHAKTKTTGLPGGPDPQH